LGLPATTINLGALKEIGILARNQNVARLLESSGIKGISNAQALQGIGWVLEHQPIQVGLFDMDWVSFAQTSSKQMISSRYRNLRQAGDFLDETGEKLKELAEKLDSLQEKDRLPYLESIFVGGLSKALKLPPDSINRNVAITSLGANSLSISTITRTIKQKTGLELQVMQLVSGPTVVQAAKIMLDLIKE
jgi:hypothetical protein